MDDSLSFGLRAGNTLQGGKYKILKVLGQGGFGITYLAEQTGLGMKVAIKEFFLKGYCLREADTSHVSIPVTDNKEIVTKCIRKFRSEARKIASLNNDHIVNIIDVFDENGTAYYVMKYLQGGALSEKVMGTPLPEEVAVGIIAQIGDALKSVHGNGLLHLDIKPANILFDERGRAVLIDFGVSKYVDSEKDSVTTSSLVGFSRGYAPLEQINASASILTPASDIYSLGATLYTLVTGIAPPDAAIVMDEGLPGLPEHLSEETRNAIRQAMQSKRSHRPQTIDAFLDLLPKERVTPELDESTIIPVVKLPEEPQVQETPVAKSGKWPLILSAAMLAGALALFGATLLRSKQAPDSQEVPQDYQIAIHASDSLGQALNQLQADYAALEKKLKSVEKEKASLSSSNKDLQQKNQNLTNQVKNLEGQVNRMSGGNRIK